MEEGEFSKAALGPKVEPREEPQEVALRAQVLTARQHKAMKTASLVMMCCSLAAFSYAMVFKATSAKTLMRKGHVQATNTFFAALNIAALGALLGIFTYHLILVHRAKLHWPRRKRVLVYVALAMLVTQFINSVFFLVPNAVALGLSCAWFKRGVFTAAFVRWSAWNCLFCLLTFHAHSIVPLKRGKRQLRRQEIGGRLVPVLVMDASTWRHLPQLALWVCMEFCIIFLAANNPHDFNFYVTPEPGQEGLPCEERRYTCKTGTQYRVLTSLWIFALVVYVLIIMAFIRTTRRRLLLAPYKDLSSVHLMVMQMKKQMMYVVVLGVATVPILWYTKWDRCNNYFVAWLGLLPLQMIASSAVFVHAFYFMPMRPGDQSMQHAWLQDFAWLEAGFDAALQQRARRSEAQRERLLREPMFCFESAIKLLLWSELVYYDYEDAGASNDRLEDELDDSSGSGAFCSCLGCGSDGLEAAEQPHVTDKRLQNGGSPPVSTKSLSKTSGGTGSVKSLRDSSGSKASLPPPPKLDVHALLQTAMQMYGLQSFEVIYEPLLETRVLLAWSDRCLVAAFRGTAGMANALSDAKAWRVPHPPARGQWWLGRQPLVHTGFLATWRANGLHERVCARVSQLVDAGAVPPAEFRVFLTGHSLGGALATLAAADLQRARRLPRLAVYTYGAPRTGNHAFASDYEALAPQTWHLINDRDAVPRSGKFVCLYKRPGQRTLINQRGDMRVRPTTLEVSIHNTGFSIKQHFMASYLQGLWSICASQRIASRALGGGPEAVDSLAASPQLQAYFATLGLDLRDLARERGELVVLDSLEASRKELHCCWGLWGWLGKAALELTGLLREALPVDENTIASISLMHPGEAGGAAAGGAAEERQPGHLATRLSAINSGVPQPPPALAPRRSLLFAHATPGVDAAADDVAKP